MRERWLWLPVALLPALILAPLAVLRFVDVDEGSYAAASALALDGVVPYRDFLYTQTPLLPYVYGAWAEVVGEHWLAIRALSLAFGLVTALLLTRHLFVRFGLRLAFLGSVLLATSTLAFTWYPPVKTYALTTALVFGAYVLISRAEPGPRAWLAAGALASFAVQTRALVVGAALAFAWESIRTGRGLLRYSIGFVVALAPTFIVFALDPRAFLFGNLGVHGVRSEGGLVGDFEQKGKVVANLLGIATDARPVTQYLLLGGAAAVAAIVARRDRGRIPLWFLVAALLALVALFPTPTYTQYFATTIPFLIVGVVELVRAAADEPATSRTLLGAVAAIWLLAYLVFAPVEFAHIVRASPEGRPARVQEVSDFVDARTDAGEEVLASWPGYIFGTHARPVPGLENDFGPHDAEHLTPAEAKRYHLITDEQVEELIRQHRTRLVVVKLWHVLPPVPDYDGAARAAGYRLVTELNGARIYVAP
ncbi:MAG: hypothetical protein QOI67_912 [Gaiellaceae bacterium]|nr:hypothetical protein [Gaiellaceae bacterium]